MKEKLRYKKKTEAGNRNETGYFLKMAGGIAMNFVIGLSLCLLSAAVSTVGVNLQKMSHMRNEQRRPSEQEPYVKFGGDAYFLPLVAVSNHQSEKKTALLIVVFFVFLCVD